jgi:uncharacterized protein YwgA
MTEHDRLGLLLTITKSLRDAGSWCGETHVQKTAYLLSELKGVNPGWKFVLYKHGPYSFDVHDDLVSAQALDLLVQEPKPPYGPSLELTEAGARILDRPGEPAAHNLQSIRAVTSRVGPKNIFELEQLATAVYVTHSVGKADLAERANQLQALKPHISPDAAQKAVVDADRLQEEVSGLAALPA